MDNHMHLYNKKEYEEFGGDQHKWTLIVLPNYIKTSLLDTGGPALLRIYSILMLVGSLCELHGGYCGGQQSFCFTRLSLLVTASLFFFFYYVKNYDSQAAQLMKMAWK